MGDRCFVTVTLRRDDMPKFSKILGQRWWTDQESIDKTQLTVFIEEANYGFEGELESLAEAGMTFMATNSAGSGYGPGATACYKGKYVYVPTTLDGELYVRWYEYGQGDAKKVEEYCSIIKKVDQYLKEEDNKVGAHSYDDLVQHIGHKIVCVGYGEQSKDNPVMYNVAIECEDCGMVLMDYDQGESENNRIKSKLEETESLLNEFEKTLAKARAIQEGLETRDLEERRMDADDLADTLERQKILDVVTDAIKRNTGGIRDLLT